MDISVVLLTWNSEKYISKCLDSLCSDLRETRFAYEIFIVDNGSKDRTTDIIHEFREAYPENIIPIYLEKNTGTTFSRNLALKKAKGKYVAVMDSDVEVFRGTFEQLITTLDEKEEVGLIAPRLLYPNGNLQKSTDVFPTVFTKVCRYFFLKYIEQRDNKHNIEARPREVDYAISAVWILKREVVGKVGLLDEKIFYAPEDVDYCLRVWKAGYKILYKPDVSCIHHTQEISRGLKINAATIEHIRGLFYYFRKHNYLLRSPKKGKSKLM
ncbi:MAG: glycosyltransferase family 2 protein [Desulfobacteraceae bacterium]|nr:glycosyltransferase family 2 protein [Desulfobacteraceae bacterium]